MPFKTLSRWLPTPTRTPKPRGGLGLESLEAREVPATLFTWTGNGGNQLWSTNGNWQGNVAPTAAVTDAQLAFPAGAFSIDDVANLSVDRITFAGGNTVLLQQQLALDGNAAGDQIVSGGAASAIAGAGGIKLNGAAAQIDVTGNASLSFNADLSGPSQLRKVGTGTLELTGIASYLGQTDVWDGTLALNCNTVNSAVPNTSLRIGDVNGAGFSAEVKLIQQGQLPNTLAVTINADGVFNLNQNTETFGDLTLNGGAVRTVGGSLVPHGDITVTDNSAIFVGQTAGTLDLAQSDHTITVAAGKNLTINAQIIGTGGIVKDGAGTLTYDTGTAALANTYTGTTTVNDGTLVLDNDTTNGAFAGPLVIGDGVGGTGAVVRLMQPTEIPNTAGVSILDDGLLNLNGFNEVVGPITLSAGAGIATGAGVLGLNDNVTVLQGVNGAATIFGNIDLGTVDRTFTVADGAAATDLILNAVITGGANAGLIKSGPGTLEIQGLAGSPNTYGGTTRVNDGVLSLNENGVNEAVPGAMVIGDGVGAAGSAVVRLAQSSEVADSAIVTIQGDGRFDANNKNDAILALFLSGGRVDTGTGVLTLNGNILSGAGPQTATITGKLALPAGSHSLILSAPLQIDAAISGAGSVDKTGVGTAVFTGANTYTGATTVFNGPLLVNGTQPTSPVSVVGGVLGGTGAVGTVTGTGGTVAPGASVGTLTSKYVALGAATFAPELNGAAAGQFDQLKVTGAVNLTGSTLAATLGFVPAPGTAFTVIDNDGADAVTGTFNNLPEGATVAIGGVQFRVGYRGGDGNDVVLTAVAPDAYAVGAGAGGGSTVRVFNPDGTPKSNLQGFEAGFSGGVRTATADVNGDGTPDLIVGSGPGRTAEVRVFDGKTGQQLSAKTPFADFQGGVFVAAGDFNADGFADIVVTPDEGGGPRVTILSGKDGAILSNFFAIDDANFRGGARAAVGDVNGDGTPDLVVSAGFGGGPRIAVYNGASLTGTPTKLMGDFFAFEQGLRNGAYAAVGDINGDGKADLIFGGGPGGGPRVLALDSVKLMQGSSVQDATVANFFAGNAANRGGVRVAAKNLDGDAKMDLVVGDGTGAGSHVTAYLGKDMAGGTPPSQASFDAFPGFLGGVFVG